MELGESIRGRGDITLVVCNADGSIAEERHERNLLCNAGLAVLAASVCYSGAADQQANLGGIPPTTYMYPMYGAVGTASPTPLVTDVALGAELARNVLSEASYSGGQVLYTFYFGTTASPWSLTECGVFLQAGSTSGSGQLLNHSVFSTVTKGAAQTLSMMVTFTFSN